MGSLQITLVTLAAVLVFWAVGAYNRLMAMRNNILRGFAPVDQQLALRHALLQRLIEALAPALPDHAQTLAAVQAACSQAQTALAHARSHPGAAGALNSLRLAEAILLETRTRLPATTSADADLAEWHVQLGAAEAALQFALTRFNNAVLEYNRAVQQFPTRLLAGLFGFRAAGAL
jgi:LemA protein